MLSGDKDRAAWPHDLEKRGTNKERGRGDQKCAGDPSVPPKRENVGPLVKATVDWGLSRVLKQLCKLSPPPAELAQLGWRQKTHCHSHRELIKPKNK